MAQPIVGRTTVAAPALAPLEQELFAAAEVRPGTHELNGFMFESEATFAGKFVGLDPESCLATDEKLPEGFTFSESGGLSGIYAAIQCTPLDSYDWAGAARERLAHSEEYLVERMLWESYLPLIASDITPGAVPTLIQGLGLLEEWIGERYHAKPTFHYGRQTGVRFDRDNLVNEKIGKWVNGRGYVSLDGPTGILDEPVLTLGAAGAGGTFVADDYFWTITALDAFGETLESNEVTAALTLNQQQVLNWAAIPGATGYKVYRGLAAGAEDTLVATVGAVTTYTDTGIVGVAATPPTENTTSSGDSVVAAAGQAWIYVTGQVLLYRGDEIQVREAHDLAHNKTFALAEQLYTPNVDGIAGAIRVTL